jgi:flavodoxin
MKSLIIYQSIHHKNTEKIAKILAEELNADLVKPSGVNLDKIKDYDLVGFGSGIYFFKMHRSILELAQKLSSLKNKIVFIFSTSGTKVTYQHNDLKEIIKNKEGKIIGEFNCRGYDTYGLLKYIGGIAKNHPNLKDQEAARSFAKNLITNVGAD